MVGCERGVTKKKKDKNYAKFTTEARSTRQ